MLPGAGWVYEYVLVDRTHQRSLAELRSMQDWYLRYQLENRPGRRGSRDHRRIRQAGIR